MQPLAWLLAYIVGFGLVQLLLYRYFHRRNPAPDPTPSVEGGSGGSFDSTSGGESETGVHCPHCGSFNKMAPTYAFCKRCVEPLRS